MTSISVRSIWSLIFFFHSFQLCNCVANLKEIGRQLRKLQMWRFSSISILLNFFRNWKLFVFTYSYKKLALVSSFQSTNFHSNQMIGCKDITVLKNFKYYAYISRTGSAITKIRKTIFTTNIFFILCKFQLCNPYSHFRKLMCE